MDATTQLKKSLITRIKQSDNVDFLKALETILDNSQEELYQLTWEQEDAIELGKNEFEMNEVMENDTVISEMKEWLSKK